MPVMEAGGGQSKNRFAEGGHVDQQQNAPDLKSRGDSVYRDPLEPVSNFNEASKACI